MIAFSSGMAVIILKLMYDIIYNKYKKHKENKQKDILNNSKINFLQKVKDVDDMNSFNPN